MRRCSSASRGERVQPRQQARRATADPRSQALMHPRRQIRPAARAVARDFAHQTVIGEHGRAWSSEGTTTGCEELTRRRNGVERARRAIGAASAGRSSSVEWGREETAAPFFFGRSSAHDCSLSPHTMYISYCSAALMLVDSGYLTRYSASCKRSSHSLAAAPFGAETTQRLGYTAPPSENKNSSTPAKSSFHQPSTTPHSKPFESYPSEIQSLPCRDPESIYCHRR